MKKSKTIVKGLFLCGLIAGLLAYADYRSVKEYGIKLGATKVEAFSALQASPRIARVWPIAPGVAWVHRENLDQIDSLRRAERLDVSGFGVSIWIDLEDGVPINFDAITSPSVDALVALEKAGVEGFWETLRRMISDGTIDFVNVHTRKNPNNDHAGVNVEEDRPSTPILEEEKEWLFSYDTWHFVDRESQRFLSESKRLLEVQFENQKVISLRSLN